MFKNTSYEYNKRTLYALVIICTILSLLTDAYYLYSVFLEITNEFKKVRLCDKSVNLKTKVKGGIPNIFVQLICTIILLWLLIRKLIILAKVKKTYLMYASLKI